MFLYYTNIITLQESSLSSLPSHGLFHCNLVLNTNNSVYSYYLLKKYTNASIKINFEINTT